MRCPSKTQPSFGSSKARHPCPTLSALFLAPPRRTLHRKNVNDRNTPVKRKDAGARAPFGDDETWLRNCSDKDPFLAAVPGAKAGTTRGITVAQVVDMSAAQRDIGRDFLTGSRAAWDPNARGGIQGKPVQHLVLETDGTTAQLQSAWKTAHQQALMRCLVGLRG